MSIKITNSLNRPITLLSLSSPSGCVAENSCSIVLNPHATVERTISLNLFALDCEPLANEARRIAIEIVARYEHGGKTNQAVVALLTATVRAPLEPLAEIDFGTVSCAQSPKPIVTIPLRKLGPLENLASSSWVPEFSTRIVRDDANRDCLQVQLNPEHSLGMKQTVLKIRGRPPGTAIDTGINVAVRADVVEDFSVLPFQIIFPGTAANETRTETIQIQSRTGQLIHEAMASVKGSGFTIEALPVANAKSRSYRVSFQPIASLNEPGQATFDILAANGAKHRITANLHGTGPSPNTEVTP